MPDPIAISEKDIKDFFENITGRAVKIVRADEQALATQVQNAVTEGKAKVEAALAAAEPEIKKDVGCAVDDLVKLVIAALEAHGL